MVYVAARPHPVLAGTVRGYAGYDEQATVSLRRREIPSGACTLILAWDGALHVDGSVRRAFLAGMHDAAALTEFRGRQQGVQVDLSPLGVLRLLDRPTAELTGRAPALDELELPELAALPARLAEDPTWTARFARVDATLRGLLDRSRTVPDPEVTHAWRRLTREAGRVPVAELAHDTGWSRRHLLTRFRGQVGLAPTTAGRVLRLRRATSLLLPGAGPERTPAPARIADVAASCGYADHSHLVREFRDLAGCTPSEYLAGWS